MHRAFLLIAAFCTGLAAQQPAARPTPADPAKFLTQPIVSEIYTADPSAHVFDGKIYVYPSHDFEAGVPQDDLGSHFAMRDYHVLSMDAIGGKVTDHGVALDIKDVPWAGRQMWAPDAAEKGGKYFLYFPVKDKQDVFRIGAAVVGQARRSVQGGAAGRSKSQLQHGPGSVQGHRRQVLHVLRRHLGRPAAAVGDRDLRREGRVPARRSARAHAEDRARCARTCSASPKSRTTSSFSTSRASR